MKANYTLSSKQHGIVIPLVAIALLALLGVTGLAVDMGHMYENKTRLQNAVDAAALSAAKTLDETKGDQAAATVAAENTVVDRNVTDAANNGANDEMSAIAKGDVLVEFFELAAGACGSAGYANCFVRVRVNNLSRPNFLIQVLGLGNTKTVAARAVAGPSPILEEVCDVVPMMVCAQDADLDDATDDGKFYGYTPGNNYCLKRGEDPAECPGAVLDNGNFQLINLDDSQGGSDICTNLSGAYSKCLKSGNIDLKPGNTVGPVEAGLNTRFNIYPQGQGQCEGVLDSTNAPPDAVVSYGTGEPGESYTSWKSAATEITNGVKGRRLVSVPVGNCPVPCTGASCVAPLLDFACFYLLQPVIQGGSDPTKGMVVGEFTNEGCVSKGKPGTDPTTGPGPYVIQLYKDPLSGDS
ncbi:MAG: pilus assembly protein TadG-related protein [Chromatiales bacterium]